MERRNSTELLDARANQLKRACSAKMWTQRILADKAGYDDKTIRNLLNKHPVKEITYITVCRALDVDPIFTPPPPPAHESAPSQYGGYSRAMYRAYESFYAFYRRDILNNFLIYKSLVHIFWNDDDNRLDFKEYYHRITDFSSDYQYFTGPICVSQDTNLLHMLTIVAGSVRVITLTKMQQPRIMHGILLTQTEAVGHYKPTVSPVVLRALHDSYTTDQINTHICLLSSTEEEYAFANSELLNTERNLLTFALSQEVLRSSLSNDMR
jgi:hypothetical protein